MSKRKAAGWIDGTCAAQWVTLRDMNASTRVFFLAGASGLVGHQVLRLALSDPAVGSVQVLARRPVTGPTDARLHVQVVDFGALPPLGPAPASAVALCALGTTIKVAGSQAAFRAVDQSAVLAFARAVREAGVRRFAVVSALGADATSSVFYNQVKGETETALLALGFDVLVIARPSLLVGDRAALGQPVRPGERVGLAVSRMLGPLIPLRWRPIDAAVVARALLRALAEAAPGVHILESADLQRRGRR